MPGKSYADFDDSYEWHCKDAEVKDMRVCKWWVRWILFEKGFWVRKGGAAPPDGRPILSPAPRQTSVEPTPTHCHSHRPDPVSHIHPGSALSLALRLNARLSIKAPPKSIAAYIS